MRTRAAIIAYHNGGERTLLEVEIEFGITPQAVGSMLKNAGITARKQPCRPRMGMPPAQLRRFRSLCNKGIPAAAAHAMVRESDDWKGNLRPLRWKDKELERLREAYEAGEVTLRVLAKRFHTSLGNISRLVADHNWTPRSKKMRLPEEARNNHKLYRKVRLLAGRKVALQAVGAI